MIKENFAKFKEVLKIKETILGIHFLNSLPKKFEHHKDTVCTALARAFKKRETLVFDACNYLQLCPGADYFLKLSPVSDREAINIYVKEEHIFKDTNVCQKFLSSLPKIPNQFKNKFIVIKPFQVEDLPQLIILLVNPAQVGRVLGLLDYQKSEKIEVFPNQPTCLSFFTPLVTRQPHLNFIDYYDRYYQGKVNQKLIWPEEEMIISLTLGQFKKVLNNLEKSPQGAFKPDLNPQKVERI